MAIPTYNQKSGFEVTIDWKDANGAPSAPVTAHWRISFGDTELVPWTQGAVTTVIVGGGLTRAYTDVNVSGLTNLLVDSNVERELHTLTYVADMDTAGEWSESWNFYVKRGGR